MIGEWLGVRTRPWAALCLGLLGCIAAQTASAADCPGHPDALGTSRTLVVDPREHPRIGTMQYPETLPLRDHEVVLSFDDGPLPRNSNQILDILAVAMREGEFLRDRPDGPRLSGRRPQAPRRRPYHRHPQPEPPAHHEQDADRARQAGDRRRHRLGEGRAWRRPGGTWPVLSHSRPAARRGRRGLPRLAGHPDLERRFPGGRLAAYFGVAGLRSGDRADRGQGKRHSAAARHPGAHRRRPAADPARAEGARLSHRPRRAGDPGSPRDADRAAAMAAASAIGNRGDLALAKNTEFRLRRRRHASRAGAVRFRRDATESWCRVPSRSTAAARADMSERRPGTASWRGQPAGPRHE